MGWNAYFQIQGIGGDTQLFYISASLGGGGVTGNMLIDVWTCVTVDHKGNSRTAESELALSGSIAPDAKIFFSRKGG